MTLPRRCGMCGELGHTKRTCPTAHESTLEQSLPDTEVRAPRVADRQAALREVVHPPELPLDAAAASATLNAEISALIFERAFVGVHGGENLRGIDDPDSEDPVHPVTQQMLKDVAAQERHAGQHLDDPEHAPVVGDFPASFRDHFGLAVTGEQGPNWVPWRTWRGPDEPIQITIPGVYQLDNTEYHADPVPGGSLSNSDAKLILPPGAPKKFRYRKDNKIREEKDSFDLGHLVHKLALGAGDEVAVRPDEFSTGYRSGKAKAWLREQREAGRIPVTPAQMEQGEAMAAALLADKWGADLLGQPGRTEQALFWRDPVTGVMERAMLDLLPDRPAEGRRMVIVDVKTAQHACPDDDLSRTIYKLGYHRQYAKYVKGVQELGLAPAGAVMVLLFVETDPPHLVTPVLLDRRAHEIGDYENREALGIFAEALESGVWKGYVDRPIEMSVPSWIERQYEGVC